MIKRQQILLALCNWERQPFQYGVADCCRFTIFMVKELTGKDYSNQFDWSNEAEAEEIIKEKGGLLQVIESVLGQPSKGVSDGSPCLVKMPLASALMGVQLGRDVVCLTQNGLARVPSRYTIAGWDLCHKQ